jgi:putative FmdB family regulatory protein
MAMYEYQCKQCGITVIVSRGINDPEEKNDCDNCNIPLTRVYSSIGVTFNGGGFYSTDKGK